MFYNKSIETCRQKTTTKDLVKLLKKVVMYMALCIDVSILFTDIFLLS